MQGIFRVLFVSLIFFAIGVFFHPVLLVGVLALLLAIPLGMFLRKGPCPNCGAGVICLSGGVRCRDCQHRLVLRSKRLVDVT